MLRCVLDCRKMRPKLGDDILGGAFPERSQKIGHCWTSGKNDIGLSAHDWRTPQGRQLSSNHLDNVPWALNGRALQQICSNDIGCRRHCCLEGRGGFRSPVGTSGPILLPGKQNSRIALIQFCNIISTLMAYRQPQRRRPRRSRV